ncbi:putative pentatricopeptide repeat-containing protein [Platanthera zijinensis]|uniref:Pentatricopeptide repeat-containing protein n=1 Tax=Platanthera zijinensis TaxID=2320716 RepID=A0AAP0B3N3_9ASPA
MLSACRTSGMAEIFQWVRESFLELGPSDSGAFALLSNIYATNDRWGDISRLRRLMRKKGIKKEPGSSIIELDGWVHVFLVGVMEHHHMEDILTQYHLFGYFLQLFYDDPVEGIPMITDALLVPAFMKKMQSSGDMNLIGNVIYPKLSLFNPTPTHEMPWAGDRIEPRIFSRFGSVQLRTAHCSCSTEARHRLFPARLPAPLTPDPHLVPDDLSCFFHRQSRRILRHFSII